MVGQVERILRRRRARALPISILTTTSVLAVAFMMVSTVWGAPVPKAVGNATFSFKGIDVPVIVKFTAFQITPDNAGDRGTFSFSLEDGRYFEFDVIHVKVRTETTAAFTGPVTSVDYPETEITPGVWIVAWAYDGGEPSSGDAVAYTIAEGGQIEAIEIANDPAVTPMMIAKILSGNINVFLPISEVPEG